MVEKYFKKIKFYFLDFFKFSVFKVLIIIFILIFTPNVFADTYNVSTQVTAPTGGSSGGGHITATELNGDRGTYSLGTRYNGTIRRIEYNLPVPSNFGDSCFWTNMTYTVTMNMATQDWRNRFGTVTVKPYSSYSSNWSNGRVTYVSYKKIYFTFKIPTSYTSCVSFVTIDLPSNELFTPFTGETNWNLSSITISDTLSSGGSGGSGGSTPTPTPTPQPNNQDIINNAKQNTQDIINNNNDNTTNIIENNNSNTESIIENNNSNTTCPSGPLVLSWDEWSNPKHFYLNGIGEEVFTSNYGISPYLAIKPNTQYTITTSGGSMPNQAFYCLYSNKDSVSSCYNYDSSGTTTFTTNQYHKYLRLSLLKVRTVEVKGPVCNNWEKEGINDTNKKLDDINNSINSDNVNSGTGSDFFNDFETSDNGGISAIITSPLNLVNAILSNNNNCDNLVLPEVFGLSNVTLPSGCILWNRASNTVIHIWNVLVAGPIAYFILRDLFYLIEDIKNPEEDRIDTLDL